jgi:hypothetical protein
MHDCSREGKPLKKKKKIGRPRAENPMVHTAVVLPPDLIAQLKADAQANEQGLSAEIRDRLRWIYSIQASPGDAETNNLVSAIRNLSDFVARDLGKRWYEDPYAMAAFRAGVADFLARHQPEGDESVRPDTQLVGDPPDVVGRTHARRIGIAGYDEDE